MSRPAQLEAQMQRVQEIQAEMLEGNEQVAPVPGTPPVDDSSTVQTLEPVTPTVVVESPVTVSKDDYDKLEQRYRTLQGMHTAEGTRNREQIAQLNSALQDLEDRLVEAERAVKPATAAPKTYVTDADKEEYGDTLEMVRRAAREEAEAVSAQREEAYLTRIAQLEANQGHIQNTVVSRVEDLSKAQAEQVKAEFWGAIVAQVPDWRTINDNADFKAWLTAEDPITGANRQQFLRQAQQELNAARVVRFFQEWKRTQAGGQTPAPNNTAQTQLERMVAPGASKGNSVSTAPEKRKWTGADISAFYKDVHTGKYADKRDEQKRIESDIFAARAEGRLV